MIRPVHIDARRAALWLVLAGAAGLLAVGFTVRAAAGGEQWSWVVVADRPIPAGTLIDDRVAQEWLRSVAVPSDLDLNGLLASAQTAVGRRTVAHLSAGEPVTAAVLGGADGTGPSPLQPGQRAVAAPLSAAGGAASALAPGMRVDVVASTGEGLTGRTRVVVADAEVLAVSLPEGGGTEAGEVLLRVGSRQALTVTAALNFAREVRLLVRPADEDSSGTPAAVGAP